MRVNRETEEANMAIVVDVLQRIFDHNDATILDEHPGVSETVAEMSRRANAFPDLGVTVETIIADEDKVAYLALAKGTHLGTFAGVPATGKPIEYQVIGLDRLENGRIVEHHANGDFLSVLRQLGVLPLNIG